MKNKSKQTPESLVVLDRKASKTGIIYTFYDRKLDKVRKVHKHIVGNNLLIDEL